MTSATSLTYVGHATVMVEMDGLRLLTDPVLRDRVAFLRRYANGVHPGRFRRVDAVLLSHLHMDHLDLPSLKMLAPETLIVVPCGGENFLRQCGFDNVVGMPAGDSMQIGSLSVRATPALHGRSRRPFGPAADPLGYVISGRHSVYFAGDTSYFADMQQIAEALDVALLPIGGWSFHVGKGHLDPHAAALAATALSPRLAIPIHWGTFCPIGVGWLNPRYLREPPAIFARHAAQLAPEVEVRILQPGGSTVYCDRPLASPLFD